MTSASDKIIDLYNRHAQAWVSARLGESHLYERGWLEKFCQTVGVRGSILDLGCGAGTPMAVYLSEQGYSVTGVDSSEVMISLFQARLPTQQAMIADMRQLALGQVFNGILAWDSFFHLNHADQRRIFAVFQKHAAPKAAMMFTSGPTHGEAIGQLEGEPLYHASLNADEYRALLHQHGFTVVATKAEDPDCRGRTIWLAQLQ